MPGERRDPAKLPVPGRMTGRVHGRRAPFPAFIPKRDPNGTGDIGIVFPLWAWRAHRREHGCAGEACAKEERLFAQYRVAEQERSDRGRVMRAIAEMDGDPVALIDDFHLGDGDEVWVWAMIWRAHRREHECVGDGCSKEESLFHRYREAYREEHVAAAPGPIGADVPPAHAAQEENSDLPRAALPQRPAPVVQEDYDGLPRASAPPTEKRARVRRWGLKVGGWLGDIALLVAMFGGLIALAGWFEDVTGVRLNFWGAVMLAAVLGVPVFVAWEWARGRLDRDDLVALARGLAILVAVVAAVVGLLIALANFDSFPVPIRVVIVVPLVGLGALLALFVLAPLPRGAGAAWHELAKACHAPRPRAFLALLALALVALPFAPFTLGDSPLWPSAGILVFLEVFIATLVLTAWGWFLETESHPRSY